jgi:hypothetical protein
MENLLEEVFKSRRLNMHNTDKESKCETLVIALTAKVERRKIMNLLQALARRKGIISVDAAIKTKLHFQWQGPDDPIVQTYPDCK